MIPAKSDVAILQFKLRLFQSLHILGLTLPLVAIGDHCFGVIVAFGVMKTFPFPEECSLHGWLAEKQLWALNLSLSV